MAEHKQPDEKPDIKEKSGIQKDKQAGAQDIDPMMLGALVCPKSRTPLVYDREAQELVSKKAGLAFPIREGVPILLIEEARKLQSAIKQNGC